MIFNIKKEVFQVPLPNLLEKSSLNFLMKFYCLPALVFFHQNFMQFIYNLQPRYLFNISFLFKFRLLLENMGYFMLRTLWFYAVFSCIRCGYITKYVDIWQTNQIRPSWFFFYIAILLHFFCFCCFKLMFLLRKSPYLVQEQENADQEELRIWTLFTQCFGKTSKSSAEIGQTCRNIRYRISLLKDHCWNIRNRISLLKHPSWSVPWNSLKYLEKLTRKLLLWKSFFC